MLVGTELRDECVNARRMPDSCQTHALALLTRARGLRTVLSGFRFAGIGSSNAESWHDMPCTIVAACTLLFVGSSHVACNLRIRYRWEVVVYSANNRVQHDCVAYKHIMRMACGAALHP